MTEWRQLELLDSAPTPNRFAATLEGLRAEGLRVGERLKRARDELAAKPFASSAEVRRLKLLVQGLEADLASLNTEARDLAERQGL